MKMNRKTANKLDLETVRQGVIFDRSLLLTSTVVFLIVAYSSGGTDETSSAHRKANDEHLFTNYNWFH